MGGWRGKAVRRSIFQVCREDNPLVQTREWGVTHPPANGRNYLPPSGQDPIARDAPSAYPDACETAGLVSAIAGRTAPQTKQGQFMLQNIKGFYGNTLAASDGDIGCVKDFYFDDKTWVVRYLVADTGSWLSGRLVLVSPHAFGRYDRDGKTLHVGLTRKQIENSPPIDSHKPVSRQYEIDY